jgi:hypothetical protein
LIFGFGDNLEDLFEEEDYTISKRMSVVYSYKYIAKILACQFIFITVPSINS